MPRIDEDALIPFRPGFWLARRAPGLPLVPAMIAGPLDHEPGNPGNLLDRSPLALPYVAELAGQECDPYEVSLMRELIPISEAEYRYRKAQCDWSRDWDAADPQLKPQCHADLTKLPPIGPGG